MCGIVGAAGDIGATEERAFKYLLMLDTIRGSDSTGIFAASKYSDRQMIVKELGTPFDGIFQSKGGCDIFRNNNKILIGHNRAATRGKVTVDNAHPFEHGDIVGVHNGTLRKQYLLKDNGKFEVDSDNLYYNISEEGLEETLKKTDGAFALCFYNKSTQELSFVRNDERPLFYAFAEDGKKLFWASEGWMLEVALGKCGIKHGTVMSFSELSWYRMPIPSALVGAKFLDDGVLGKFKVKPVKEYEPPPPVVYSYGNQRWNYDDDDIPGVSRRRNSNLVPYQPPGSNGRKIFLSKDYEDCLNKFLHFEVVSCKKEDGYIQLETTHTNSKVKEGIPSKLFPQSEHSILWGMFDKGDELFARVKKITRTQGSAYLLLDIRSLNERHKKEDVKKEEPPFDPDIPEDLIPVGESRRLLPVKDFQRFVGCGCSNCTSALSVDDIADIIWVGDSPFCAGCKDMAEMFRSGVH